MQKVFVILLILIKMVLLINTIQTLLKIKKIMCKMNKKAIRHLHLASKKKLNLAQISQINYIQQMLLQKKNLMNLIENFKKFYCIEKLVIMISSKCSILTKMGLLLLMNSWIIQIRSINYLSKKKKVFLPLWIIRKLV